MRSLWIAIAAVLSSATPQPQAADQTICTLVPAPPLHPQKHINGAAPITDLT